MTIQTLIQTLVDRLAHLDRFLRAAHAGRRIKESAVARRVRRRLIVELGEMIDFEREALAVHRDYFEATTEAERARDDREEPDFYEDADEFIEWWSDLALLSASPIMDGDRAFDPCMGRYYWVEEGYPVTVPVLDAELGTLSDLIRRIENELGIRFVIQRVFWTETALCIFSVQEEERERLAAAP